MSRSLTPVMVLISFLIVGCSEKQSTVRIQYRHEISKNITSDNYAAMLFDSVSITIDDRKNFQMLEWSSAGEKYYLIADKSKQYLLVANESGNYRYEKDEMVSRLDGFYFPAEVKRKELDDTEVAGIKAKNAICMVDSLKGNMKYAADYKNRLPFFAEIPGIPLDFYINVCGDHSGFIAVNQIIMKFTNVLIPRDISRSDEVSFQAKKSPGVKVYGVMENQFSQANIPFAEVRIFADGKFSDVIVSDCNGDYEMYLDYNKDYMLHVNCKGMVSKIVQLDLRNMPTFENDPGYEMELKGRLFDEIPGLDFSILQKPLAIARYNPELESIEFDFPYTERMLEELNKILEKK